MAEDLKTLASLGSINSSSQSTYISSLSTILFYGIAKNEIVIVETVILFVLFLYFARNFNGNKNEKKPALPVDQKHTKRKLTTATIPQARNLFPIHLPIIDGIYTLYRLRKDGVDLIEDWVPKFGGLFEIPVGTAKCYAVYDPSVIQKVLTSSSPGHMNKPSIYNKIFVDSMRDGLVNSEYPIWSRHRKMLSRVFTYKAMQTYLKFMNLHAQNLTKSLELECIRNKTDGKDSMTIEGEKVWKLLYFHAIKIISYLVLGHGRLSDEETSQFHQDFANFKHAVLERLMNPQLHIPPYWYFHPKRKEYERLSNACDTFANKNIQSYRREYEQLKANNKPKFVAGQNKISNVASNNTAGGEAEYDGTNYDDNSIGEKPFRCLIEEMIRSNATDKEIHDEVGTFFSAGHETTVTALQMFLMHLALNPLHQTLCREEVESVLAGKLDHNNQPHDAQDGLSMSMDDLSNLKHLERCILESIRLTPTIPMFIRRLDVPLDIDEDLVLRGGSSIIILPWMVHRDPENYPDPKKFDPDRFLPENIKSRHPYSYIPFSAGPRNCIGYKLSIMEMKVIMSWILYHFEIYTTDKLEDVKLHFEVTLLPERNYNVILKRMRKI